MLALPRCHRRAGNDDLTRRSGRSPCRPAVLGAVAANLRNRRPWPGVSTRQVAEYELRWSKCQVMSGLPDWARPCPLPEAPPGGQRSQKEGEMR